MAKRKSKKRANPDTVDYKWFVLNAKTGELVSGWGSKKDAYTALEDEEEPDMCSVLPLDDLDEKTLQDFCDRNDLTLERDTLARETGEKSGGGEDGRNIKTVKEFRAILKTGPYAWPGGYPLYFVLADGEALSFKAAKEEQEQVEEAIKTKDRNSTWRVVGYDVNWEDTDLECAHTGKKIESAYGDDSDEDEDEDDEEEEE